MREENYFSWKNLKEIAEIEQHLAFAEKLINAYSWEESADRQLRETLRLLKEKQKDEKLNLSVIGEFATGKSTFINALLRVELLEACVLQGTTVASTIIEYAKQYTIRLIDRAGNSKTIPCGSLEQLRETLREYTTKEELAKDLQYVYACLPSEILQLGIRIIDTPGTNATTRWHEEVTIHTLNDLSDASVVLTTADHPLAETTIRFVEGHLSSVLKQCVFVAAKIDLIPQGEREQILSYIKMKASDVFDLQDPMVLPYASLEVLGGRDSELAKLSYQSEEILMHYLAKQRSIMQVQKLTILVDEIYGMLSEELNANAAKHREELAILERFHQVDLETFIGQQKSEREDSFRVAAGDVCRDIVKHMHGIARKAKRIILDELEGWKSYGSVNLVKSYVDSRLPEACEEQTQKIVSIIQKEGKKFDTVLQGEIRVFQTAFEKLFQGLDVLGTDSFDQEIRMPESIHIDQQSLEQALKYAIAENSKENKTALGGAAAGAAVGTALAPGMGTLIGGAVGAFVGSLRRTNMGKLVNDLKEKLDLPLEKYFENVINEACRSLNEYVHECDGILRSEIQKYKSVYEAVVTRRIQEEQEKRRSLEEKLEKIRADMDIIDNRKSSIRSINERIAKVTD